MAFTNPSVQDFKNQLNRDFPYGTDPDVSVLDSDIAYSFQMANMNMSQAWAPDQGTYTVLYVLLSAHYLVLNIRASSQGINGQYNWLQASKGVGSVNEAFAIPEWIQKNAFMSQLSKTNYGAQFLQLVLPQLIGAMFSAYMPAHAL